MWRVCVWSPDETVRPSHTLCVALIRSFVRSAPEVLRRFEANGAEDGDWGAVDAAPARTPSDPRMD